MNYYILAAFTACGLVLGYLISNYQDKLIKTYLPREYRSTKLKELKFKIIFTIACGLLCTLTYVCYKDSLILGSIIALSCLVLANIFAVDFTHSIIFDRFQVIFFALGLAECIAEAILDQGYNVASHAIGLFLGGFFFLAVALIGKKIYRKDVMGMGDVKLAFSAGLFLGWERLLFALLVATISGSIILLIIKKKNNDEKEKEYPFAPFITAGIVIAILFGQAVIKAYLGLFSL